MYVMLSPCTIILFKQVTSYYVITRSYNISIFISKFSVSFTKDLYSTEFVFKDKNLMYKKRKVYY